MQAAGDLRDTALTRFSRRFFLSHRFALRISQRFGPAVDPTGPGLSTATLLTVAGDLAQWLVQRRSHRAGIAFRLPLDVADEVWWSRRAHDDYLAVSGATRSPLSLEAALRYGLPGLAVPAVGAFATWAIQGRRGTPSIDTLIFPFAAGLGGLFARRTRTKRMETVERHHGERLAAERAAAELAGRHAVAAGADSVVDRLEGVAPLLGRPAEGSALFELLDAWKQLLAADAAGQARYLGTEVSRWERRHNLHPDLASHVQVTLAEGDGTQLLSPLQVDRVHDALDGLDLRGGVSLRVLPGRRTRPSDPLVLCTPTHRISLAADRRALGSTHYDLTAAQLMSASVMVASYGMRGAGDVPWRWWAAAGLAYPMLGVWTHRNMDPSMPDRHVLVVALSTTIGALYSIAGARAQRRTHSDAGIAIYPFIAALEAPVGTLSFSWLWLSPRARVTTLAAIAFTACGAFALGRPPRSITSALFELLWLASSLFDYAALPRLLHQEADEVSARLAADDHAEVEAAYEHGRQDVLDLVRRAHDDARAQLDAARMQLDPEITGEVERRLAAVDDLLDDLRREH